MKKIMRSQIHFVKELRIQHTAFKKFHDIHFKNLDLIFKGQRDSTFKMLCKTI